jgi:hypothetical protein
MTVQVYTEVTLRESVVVGFLSYVHPQKSHK